MLNVVMLNVIILNVAALLKLWTIFKIASSFKYHHFWGLYYKTFYSNILPHRDKLEGLILLVTSTLV